jgi:hypothetical protein
MRAMHWIDGEISLLALAAAPLSSALTIDTPTNWTSGGQAVISWENAQGDPSTWSFELINVVFNDAFAIANNVDPSSSPLTIELPIVPAGAGYTLEAVNIGNITNVYATTASFSIGGTVSGTSSGTATGTGATTATGAVTTTGAATTPATVSGVVTGTGTTARTGTTAGTGTAAGTGAGTGTAATTAASPTKSSGAASFKYDLGTYAVALVGAVAGAAAVL